MHGFPRYFAWNPRALQEKLRNFANKEYKQEAFYPAHEAFLQWQYKCTAQCFQCVQSYFNIMKLISKSIDCESKRGNEVFFGDHPNFGQYNTFSGVIYVEFSFSTLRYLNIFKYEIEHVS